VSAIPALVSALPDIRVVLVGSGEEEQALKRQAAELGVDRRVIFTGARSDVPRLLPVFDVFCMPSYLEGTCNAVLEAFAMKVPVVASSAGGLPELVEPERTGLLVPPRDPAALSAALLRMLRERELARRCTEAAFALVHERYGVERMVSRTAALYQEVMTA
jgi:glycosyltransferase involved in cell wall biosynthesis